MLRDMLGNRWRLQEYELLLVAAVGVLSLVYASGGDPPWWASALAGVGLAMLIDVAEGLGRRRAQPVVIVTREDLD
jgi:hypothetical protein